MPDVFIPPNREAITEEPDRRGDWADPAYPDNDWIGHRQQGGGKVPPDFEWRSNPRHDRLPVDRGN